MVINLKVIVKKTAGLDIHKTIVVCTVRHLQDDGETVIKETKDFRTFPDDLVELGRWLESRGIEVAVMESTSVYWKPVYTAIEDLSFRVMVVNARHVKAVPGRKTDVLDSEWLATLVGYGLLRPSFIPNKDFREIRIITRYRRKLSQMLGSEKNRLQKILEDCGIKLGCVVSDIDGVSAREMIASIIEGDHSPEEIALLAKGRLKNKVDDLKLSMNIKISDRHRFLLQQIQGHMAQISEELEIINDQVVASMMPYQEEWQLLQTIPGIDKMGAAMLLAEIGINMNQFGSKDRFCSWAGMCPGNNSSAGKRKSGRTTKGNTYIKSLLCEFANSARKTKTQFKSRFDGLVIRRGYKKSIIALGHRILEIVYILLKNKIPYKEPSVNYEELIVKRNAPRWIKKLKEFGYISKNQTP